MNKNRPRECNRHSFPDDKNKQNYVQRTCRSSVRARLDFVGVFPVSETRDTAGKFVSDLARAKRETFAYDLKISYYTLTAAGQFTRRVRLG